MNPKDIPLWNSELSYFEQKSSTLQFFNEEFNKIKNGINIGGYFVHPWLYWHVNFYMTKIVQRDKSEPIINPPLDDHALYFIENYQEAEKRGLGLFMFGTRGFSKTVLEGSIASWKVATSPNGIIELYGGSKADLVDLTNVIQLSNQFIHPAFKVPILREDWGTKVDFGVRERNGSMINHAMMKITTVDGATDNSSEKGAGGTPACVLIDEAGKFDPIPLITSLKPKIWSQYGAKLVPILSGTGGNEFMSKGAKKILEHPADFLMLPMDYSVLNKRVPKEYHTWNKTEKKPFCTFVPGQMSYRVPVEKLSTNLSDYLDMDNDDLKKIAIRVTDWENATKYLKAEINSYSTMEAKSKQRMYHPLDTDDCFLSDSYNPFDADKLMQVKSKLLRDNAYRKITLNQDMDGAVRFDLSDKKPAERAYENKSVDAPLLLFGDVEENPVKWKYVSGLDDYKLISSKDTSSLGSFYVIKRRGVDINSPIEQIVMSYTARPHSSHNDLYENIRMGNKMFNAMLNMESIDVGFASYLETVGFDIFEFIIPNINPGADILSKSKFKTNSRFGTYPTPANKKLLLDTVVQYTKEEVITSFNENGEPIRLLGADFIPDPWLIDEMIDFHAGGNFDRIDAFGYALLLARYLDKIRRMPDQQKVVGGTRKMITGSEAILKKRRQINNNKGFVNFGRPIFHNF